jgi:SAM-dependent methyltransferase
MSLPNNSRAVARRLAIIAARVLPAKLVERLFVGVVYARALSLRPEEALRMLFRIDGALYQLQGDRALAYGNGRHPKHRHIGYHDFFTERIGPNERVLDVGCGIGALAHSIAARSGATVLAVDISPGKIAEARVKHAHAGVQYIVGDATRLDTNGKVFDVVVLSNVLEHLTGRSEFLRAVIGGASAHRALIRVPLFERDWRVALKRELDVDYRLDPTHETEYTLESFEREMKEAGVDVLERQFRWGEIWAEVAPRASDTLRGDHGRAGNRDLVE